MKGVNFSFDHRTSNSGVGKPGARYQARKTSADDDDRFQEAAKWLRSEDKVITGKIKKVRAINFFGHE
jgi:hypothetical protein